MKKEVNLVIMTSMGGISPAWKLSKFHVLSYKSLETIGPVGLESQFFLMPHEIFMYH